MAFLSGVSPGQTKAWISALRLNLKELLLILLNETLLIHLFMYV